mmetsp:Transcript_44187/g.102036  ORF Transcript_44187/g.102036 Transcript_44187/m.102036 type:complete len:258 (+) Transcript_44187:1388-2161(+)
MLQESPGTWTPITKQLCESYAARLPPEMSGALDLRLFSELWSHLSPKRPWVPDPQSRHLPPCRLRQCHRPVSRLEEAGLLGLQLWEPASFALRTALPHPRSLSGMALPLQRRAQRLQEATPMSVKSRRRSASQPRERLLRMPGSSSKRRSRRAQLWERWLILPARNGHRDLWRQAELQAKPAHSQTTKQARSQQRRSRRKVRMQARSRRRRLRRRLRNDLLKRFSSSRAKLLAMVRVVSRSSCGQPTHQQVVAVPLS